MVFGWEPELLPGVCGDDACFGRDDWDEASGCLGTLEKKEGTSAGLVQLIGDSSYICHPVTNLNGLHRSVETNGASSQDDFSV